MATQVHRAPARQVAGTATSSRRSPRPAESPLRGNDLRFLVVVNLVVVGAMWWRHGGPAMLTSAGGWLIALGRLTGLYGTLAVLAQLVLISRVPWLERRYGMDRLNFWHRWNGFAVLWLLAAHTVTLTVGYALLAQTSVFAQVGDFILNWPDLLMAFVAFGLVVMVALTSVRAARRALSYETWWFVHLYAYLAVALSVAHEFAVGGDLVSDGWARAYWIGAYLLTAVALFGFRWLQPLWRAARHRLRVAAVVQEAPGVVSITLRGRRLDRLPAAGGQFFLLRLLTRDSWYEAHPLSLSAVPDGRSLRFTVKSLGDATARLQKVKVGTRVMAEGPYGCFTAARSSQRKVALIAGGVGVTPIRAIYEDLDRKPGEVTLLYRARRREEEVLHDELVRLSRQRGYGLKISHSRPMGVPVGDDPFRPDTLLATIPDLAQRDVFVCGPASLIGAATNGLRRAGVPRARIHSERFDY